VAGLYAERLAWRLMVESGDPVVYRVDAAPVPDTADQLPFAVTTIQPGSVGDELFMTRGHRHREPSGEVYVGLGGHGLMVLYDGDETRVVEISPGTVAYTPPGWAHRSVNTGTEPFRFLAVHPGGVGQDHASIAAGGCGARVLRAGDGCRVVPARTGRSSGKRASTAEAGAPGEVHRSPAEARREAGESRRRRRPAGSS